MFSFTEITKEEYNKLNLPTLFTNRLGSWKFGVINFNNHFYKFSWQSELINPLVIELITGIFCVGIDLNVIVIDSRLNKIIHDLYLNSFFFDVQIIQGFIYIISELEIIQIDKTSLNIVKHHYLPDIFEEMTLAGHKIIVKCMSNTIIELSI